MVITIIAVLVGLLLPAVQAAREAARQVHCPSNFKQIGLAIHGYHDVWHVFPPAYVTPYALRPSRQVTDLEPGTGWAWGTLVLPYLEQRPLYDAANFDLGFGATKSQIDGNRTVIRSIVSTFHCPSGGGSELPLDLGVGSAKALCSPGQYIASAGWMDASQSAIQGTGVLYPNSRVAIGDVSDGTSGTLMIGERSRNLADATWTGVFASHSLPVPLCTTAGWPVESCVGLMFLLMGRTGPSSDILSGGVPGGNTPNYPSVGADGFASRHPADANSFSATAQSGL